MIIRPYSDTSSQNLSDYPCVKTFFKCSETGGTSILESISGQMLVPTSGSFSFPTANAVTFTAGTTFILSNSVSIGSKKAVSFSVVNLSAALSGVSFAGGSSSQFDIASGFQAPKVSDGTNSATSLAVNSTGSIIGASMMLRPGTSGQGQKIVSTTTTYTADTAVNSAPGNLTSMPNITSLSIVAIGTTVTMYGCALFVFNSGEPANLSSGLEWMTQSWQNGDKRIYPGWKGIA